MPRLGATPLSRLWPNAPLPAARAEDAGFQNAVKRQVCFRLGGSLPTGETSARAAQKPIFKTLKAPEVCFPLARDRHRTQNYLSRAQQMRISQECKCRDGAPPRGSVLPFRHRPFAARATCRARRRCGPDLASRRTHSDNDDPTEGQSVDLVGVAASCTEQRFR